LSDEIKQETKQLIEEQEPIQAFASFNDIQQLYLNANYPNGINSFANFTAPKGYRDQVKKAKELRQYSIAKKLLDIRKDYSLPVKEFKCKAKRQQKYYNEVVLPLVQRYARQFVIERHSVGEIFAHYGFKADKKTPMFLRLEDAENIIPVSALGFEVYEVQLSSELKSQIKKLQKQKMIDKLPDYLRNAINSEGYIQEKTVLDYNSMHRTAEDKQDYEFRVKPPILNIFKQLVLREFLIDMDYATAYASGKTSIIHTKCGTDNAPIKDEKTLKAIHDVITNRPNGSCFVTTRGDISINSVDIKLSELFDPKKFQQVNSDIMDYFGLPVVFIPSQSGGINNTTVVVSLKPFEQSIKTDRKIFREFLDIYFDLINKKNGFSERVKVEYEHTNIRDSAELIKELGFLKESGVLTWEDICLEFDYDKEEQLEKKKFDWDNRDLEAETYENSQGLSPLLEKTVEQKIRIANETKQVDQGGQNNQNNVNTNSEVIKNAKRQTKQKEKEG